MEKKKHHFKFTISNRKIRQAFIISVVVILVLIAAVGTTVAFIATKTDGVKNVFDPVTIQCEVTEDYKVKNIGEYEAYIRAYFVVNWVDEDGNVYGQSPVSGTDYSISVNAADNNTAANTWDIGNDGFYYYTSPVAVDKATEKLINSVNLQNSAPDGYELKVQIVAEAMQAKPTTTVESYWGVTVNNNLISK